MQIPNWFLLHSWLSTMLVACLPLLVTLLVGLLSTATAQTLDHQQESISGVILRNPRNPGDFGGENLSKPRTHSVVDPPMDKKFDSKDELEKLCRNSGMTGFYQRSFHIMKPSVNITFGEFPCPDPTAIAPCICSFTDTSELLMDCSAVESGDQLAAVFKQNFSLKEFKEFKIENNNNIKHLSDIFNGVSFRFFVLSNVPNLVRITNDAFIDSREKLENITILSSALDENTFPFNTLDEYKRLTSLTIYGHNMKFLPAINSSSINYMHLAYGHISALPHG